MNNQRPPKPIPSQPPSDRLPPQNMDAERGLLGSLLRENSVIGDILQTIQSPEDFYADAHQKIFTCIRDLHLAGKPVDAVILADVLKDRGQIEDAGGYGYLGELWAAAPTAANAEHYARIVRDKSVSRNLIRLSTRILRDAYDQVSPADELLGEAVRELLEVQQATATNTKNVTVRLSEAIKETEAEIDKRHRNRDVEGGSVRSGLLDLDELTGGFHAGELVIIAARPSVGKTALAMQVVEVAGEDKIPTLFFSLEQSRTELVSRMLCGRGQVDSHLVRTGRLGADEFSRLTDAATAIKPLPIWINDNASQRVSGMLNVARKLMTREKIQLIAVDYLQLVTFAGDRQMNRNDQVSTMTRELKLMARSLGVPLLLLCQITRDSERQNRKPRLSDLRDSGSIEQDADTVLFLHRAKARDESSSELIEAIVAKQRNGPTGDVTLRFFKRRTRFECVAGGTFGGVE